MFRLQHQFNNIVETTQLANDQMKKIPLSKQMFEVFTTSSKQQHQPPVALFEKSFTALSISPWQVAPDNLKRLLEFSNCLRLCFKLAVSFQHCTPHMIVQWVHIRRIWKPLVFGDEIWTIGSQPVLCAVRNAALRRYVCADAPSCWKMNPVGRRRLL